MKLRRLLMPGFAVVLLSAPALADVLNGADRLLCSLGQVTVCYEDGDCEVGTAGELNIPQFIEVDVVAKRLSTTKASGLNRTSTADNVKRTDGSIVLQGFENNRAYSIVINEATGALAAAVAAPSRGVTAFGACTPQSTSK